jgi:hypothetical protein
MHPMDNYPTVKDSNLRKLTCNECGEDLDLRSHFIKVKKNEHYTPIGGIEIHVRCLNNNCDKSNHEKNKDYFTPVFVGAI